MIKFFNSLTKKKEEFVPYNKNVVNMYSCGPTVYSYQHIGNMRAYLFMDSIRRVLKYNGYKINGVMNITDVGHLTSDADAGEDKMAVAAKRENKTPWEIAEYYKKLFMEDIKKLNVDIPEHVINATAVIREIIDFVKGLQDKGFAYETSKGVYYDIKKFNDYGKLGGASLDDKLAGARIDVDDEKRHPADFALWIKAPKEHIMQWPSPWGMGYPGWHIECSAIGNKILGEHIDIHTGGVDHKTIHHENEIAQSDALAGKPVVKFWMHLEFLQIESGKMSKSLGNIYTIHDLEKKGYDAHDFRYFIMTAHYSKPQNFTFEALTAARNAFKSLKNIAREHEQGDAKTEGEVIKKYEQEFLAAVNDDINLPLALGVVWTMLKEKRSPDIYNLLLRFNDVLGLNLSENQVVPEDVKKLADERWKARQEKNWAKSDDLRKILEEKGYTVKDGKEGYELSRI